MKKKIEILLALCCALPLLVGGSLFAAPLAWARPTASSPGVAQHIPLATVFENDPRLGLPGPPSFWKARATPGLPLPCQGPGSSTPCYAPAQIQKAYGEAPLLAANVDGRGQKIVIVDDSQDPSLRADLHAYNQAFGLPDAPLNISSVGCSLAPTWSCQPGPPGAANQGISVEISIDVEWAHALAPRASIELLEVNDDSATTFEQILEYYVAAAGYAIDTGLGEVVSLSVGFAEQCSPAAFISFEHGIFMQARNKGITVLAGTGDVGATQFTCDATSFLPTPVVAIPASDPFVLAVGGTHLIASTDGDYKSESAWTQPQPSTPRAGGGGFSSIYPRPGFQLGVPGAWRGIPDVSLNADDNTGYIVECSYCNAGIRVFFQLGGTSISAPAWGGLVALANQLAGHALGFVNPALYKIAQGPFRKAAFHDIVTGNNSFTFVNSGGQTVTVPGYNAVPGWDAATGLGTPNAVVLLPLLAAAG